MLKDNKHILHEGILSDYEDSTLVVFGIPYDGTVSYRPGTRFGPMDIRENIDGIETYSPYMDDDMTNYNICDMGDLELPFGNREKVLDIIKEETKIILKDGKIPLGLGGEHLVSFPIVEALSEKYKNLAIIHFDAHADLRDDYLGEKLSHATVIRRIYDILGDKSIFQFGIRSGTKEEFEFAKDHCKTEKFSSQTFSEVVDDLGDRPIYLTIDLDVLDPSIFPGTGTPEPGGLTFNELSKCIKAASKLNIVGCDIVELSPKLDSSGVSTITACKVLREVLLAILNNNL